MNIQSTTARGGRKIEQVLEGAREVFMRDGFEGASVDDIARSAGVSKATLYNYFPDKRILFMEVAKAELPAAGELGGGNDRAERTARRGASAAADRLMTLILSPFGRNVFKVCVSETDRFPEIGREFWDSGPARVRAKIIEYLEQAVERGELEDRGFRSGRRPVR